MKITVHSLTVDTPDSPSIHTMVFLKEQEVYEGLRDYYTNDDDPEFDPSDADDRARLVEFLTEKQGLVLYIDTHALEV